MGGIVPHITLKSIANDEPAAEEVLVDRPEEMSGITRVTGPFTLEATIPTPVDYEGDGVEDSGSEDAGEHGDFVDRMVEVLRRSPDLRLPGRLSGWNRCEGPRRHSPCPPRRWWPGNRWRWYLVRRTGR